MKGFYVLVVLMVMIGTLIGAQNVMSTDGIGDYKLGSEFSVIKNQL